MSMGPIVNAAGTAGNYALQGAKFVGNTALSGAKAVGNFAAEHPVEMMIAAQTNDPTALISPLLAKDGKPTIGKKLTAAQQSALEANAPKFNNATGPFSGVAPAPPSPQGVSGNVIATPASAGSLQAGPPAASMPVATPAAAATAIPQQGQVGAAPAAPATAAPPMPVQRASIPSQIWKFGRIALAGYQGGPAFVSIIDSTLEGARDSANADAISMLAYDITQKKVKSMEEVASSLKQYGFRPGTIQEWTSTYDMADKLLKYDDDAKLLASKIIGQEYENSIKDNQIANMPVENRKLEAQTRGEELDTEFKEATQGPKIGREISGARKEAQPAMAAAAEFQSFYGMMPNEQQLAIYMDAKQNAMDLAKGPFGSMSSPLEIRAKAAIAAAPMLGLQPRLPSSMQAQGMPSFPQQGNMMPAQGPNTAQYNPQLQSQLINNQWQGPQSSQSPVNEMGLQKGNTRLESEQYRDILAARIKAGTLTQEEAAVLFDQKFGGKKPKR